MEPRGQRRCIYCGSGSSLTRDHVPPKALFATPRPPDLLTVPSCRPCNESFSSDDDYVRAVFVSRSEAGGHPDAEALRPKVDRSFNRPERSAALESFRRSLRLDPWNSDGVRVLKGSADLAPFSRVGKRITRGLYYHVLGSPLPLDCEMKAGATWEARGAEATRLLDLLSGQQEHVVGAGTFSYRYFQDPAHPAATAWLFLFYGKIPLLSITRPPGFVPPSRPSASYEPSFVNPRKKE